MKKTYPSLNRDGGLHVQLSSYNVIQYCYYTIHYTIVSMTQHTVKKDNKGPNDSQADGPP